MEKDQQHQALEAFIQDDLSAGGKAEAGVPSHLPDAWALAYRWASLVCVEAVSLPTPIKEAVVGKRNEAKTYLIQNYYWKNREGRVTLALDKVYVSFVRQTRTDGIRLEYSVVDLAGTAWNPAKAPSPQLYVYPLDSSGAAILSLNAGDMPDGCGAHFHQARQLSYRQHIFDLIQGVSIWGTHYEYKPC